MGLKSVPRELSIYLCMRTSFRKCPHVHALIHRTVQFCRVCITSYHTKTMDPDTTIPVRDYSSKKEEQLLRRRVRERARRAAKLQTCGQPIATVKAVHTGANAAKASPDDAFGLEAL